MVWVTKVFTWTLAYLSHIVQAFTHSAAFAEVATWQVDLISAGPAFSPAATYGQYTVCTYTGYAAVTVAASGPVYASPMSIAALVLAEFLSIAGSPYVPDTAIGYVVSDGAGNLVGGEMFATPQPFDIPGRFLSLSVLLPLSGFVTP